MQESLTSILADYLTGRISTVEALKRSRCQAVDDLVRAARVEGDDVARYASVRHRERLRGGARG